MHDHAHHDNDATFGTAFRVGIALNLLYVAAEAGAGFYLGSLALLADAGHNLGDVAGLALSWLGAGLAGLPPTRRRSYGLRRATILAALGNAVLLLVAVGAITWEAIDRLRDPQPIDGMIVLAVAVVGLLVNTGTAMLFWRGRHHDLNIRSAFLHMAADALVTAGVIAAAILIMWTGWLWLDPALALVVAVVILIGTWGLLRESLDLALDAVPAGIDPEAVQAWLQALPGVTEVHDLHIWPLSTTDTALTVHLVRSADATDD
ncbi:MAG: cation transporter, partial [Candidatus Dadabacteria bacterium]